MTRIDRFQSISIATLWTTLDFVLGRGLNILFIALLARLLTPHDFGTFALLAIFLGVSTALIESGFGLALIQRQDTTDDDKCTVFWISLAVATIIALVLVAAAPAIAGFFDIDVLVQLTYVMALTVWVSGFGIVQRALLVKRLAFRQLTVVNLSALLISSSLAVYLAVSGLGVFTLAWQGFLSALVTSVLLWLLNGWRPRLFFSLSSAKRLFGFGGFMLASKLVDVIYSKTYTLLIGKFYGTVELGQFNRAESTAQTVTGLVVHPISQIAFPAFSNLDGDRARMRAGLQRAVRVGTLFNAVAMFTLAATAKPFVLTLLGPQWEPSVPILQVLCLSSVMMPLHVLNLQALMALGRSDQFFVLEVVKKVIGVAILVFASRYGAMGIAWGLVVAGFIAFIINAWYSGIHLDYGPLRQAGQILPSFAFGLISASAAYLALVVTDIQSSFLQLLMGIGASTTTSVAILALAWILGHDPTGLLYLIRNKRITKHNGAPN